MSPSKICVGGFALSVRSLRCCVAGGVVAASGCHVPKEPPFENESSCLFVPWDIAGRGDHLWRRDSSIREKHNQARQQRGEREGRARAVGLTEKR